MPPANPTKTTKTKSAQVGKKGARSATGAPSQHNQTSRKGKRAWRKNVDIEEVEAGLEEMRAEERVIGTALQKTQDSDLFQIDVRGDDQIRKALPRYSKSQLTSTKILSQRSAVPAVFSRPTPTSTNKRKSLLSHEDKARLLRIAKRPRKGPFNSIMDPSEFESGSGTLGLSEAVKQSGTYDPWGSEPVQEEIKDGLETVQKKKIKAPVLSHPKDIIAVPAISEPHQGTSYNPPVDAHQELLLEAHEEEERRVREVERLAEVKEKIEGAWREAEVENPATAPGMKVDVGSHDDDGGDDKEGKEGEEGVVVVGRKLPMRKTQSQRKKAARLLAEKRALAERVARKRMMEVIPSAKVLRRTNAKVESAREEERHRKKLGVYEKLRRRGLAGQRLGKHKVTEGRVDVQLGEELSESLRALKPEGNLFRDRFVSMQQRALIEPRVPVLPKKHRTKIVEYEKHAWKRFE